MHQKFYILRKTAEAYYRLFGNIPSALLEVNQHIHSYKAELDYLVQIICLSDVKKIKSGFDFSLWE